MGLKKAIEKDLARTLFISENLSQKEIADRVWVTEKTLSKWIKEGHWEKLKRSLLTSKQFQINNFYNQLEFLNAKIASRDYKVAEPKEADIISKITSAIEKLETEPSIAQTIEVCRDVIEYIRQFNLEDAKKLIAYFDKFIQTKLKK